MAIITSASNFIQIDNVRLPKNNFIIQINDNSISILSVGNSFQMSLDFAGNIIDGSDVNKEELVTFLETNSFKKGGGDGEGSQLPTITNRQLLVNNDPLEAKVPTAGLLRPNHWSQIFKGAPTDSGTYVAAFTNNPVNPEEDMFFIKTVLIPEFGTAPIYDVGGRLFVYTGDDPNHAVNRKDLSDAIAAVSQGASGVDTVINNLQAVVDDKVDKIPNMGLSEVSYTLLEKAKLASVEDRWGGRHNSIASLNLVTGKSGWEAFVSIDGGPIVVYVWNTVTGAWESSLLAASEESPESIKTKYESNPDTNAYLNNEKAKLLGIAAQATKNQTDAYLLSLANSTGNLPSSRVTPSSTLRFVTDAQIASWTAKQDALASGTTIKTINNISIPGNGNINTNAWLNTSTVNNVRTREYFDRFEYFCKITFNLSVAVPPANYTTSTTTTTLPTGVTISGCDEHYISVRNDNRGITVNVFDNSSRAIVLGFCNTWPNAANTAIGSVCIKLIKYK